MEAMKKEFRQYIWNKMAVFCVAIALTKKNKYNDYKQVKSIPIGYEIYNKICQKKNKTVQVFL